MTITQNNLRDMLAGKHNPFNLKEFVVDAIVCIICLFITMIAVGLCFASFEDAAIIEKPAQKYSCKPVAEKPSYPYWAYKLKGGVK